MGPTDAWNAALKPKVRNCMLALLYSLCQGPWRSQFLTKQDNGGQKKVIASGTGCNDDESAVHEPKM
jgi:hypothetical protein